MFKKLASLILCLFILATVFSMPFNAAAKSYKEQLIEAGFPESYTDALVTLHNKYPKWVFKPFKTGLDWQEAVDGERSPHRDQVIQKGSGKGDEWMCQCSDCKGVYHDGYSASEQAVKYYMDPRNWLSERYIFQFESTAYSSSQTKSGVEAIIKSTWMKDANITYNSTESKTVTFKNSDGNTVKYSAAIIEAAKSSSMSSYFLASKIVQEVGASKPTAGGASGSRVPFTGIYNYYNIGAYTGAMDGLQWASGFIKTKTPTLIYSDKEFDTALNKPTGKGTPVSQGMYASYIKKSGSYYKVKLYKENSGTFTKDGAIGYILITDLNTSYFNYGRPWTNPYLSIINGAKYIANGYANNQYTGYLMKYNVNKDSGSSLYGHEYMTNVDGAASEASHTYQAYSNNNLMSQAKTFYIPVFSNMPKSKCTVTSTDSQATSETAAPQTNPVKGLTLESRTKTSLTYKWNKLSGATKYYVYVKNVTKGSTFSKTVTTNSATLNNLTPANKYSVKVKAYTSKGWSDYSSTNTKHALPDKMEKPKLSSPGDTYATLKWSAVAGADGYYIYSYDSSSKKYTKLQTVDDGKASSVKVKSLKSASKNTLAICAYTVDSKTKEGAKSDKVSTETKPLKITLKSVSSPSKTKIKATWSAAKGGENGYEIQYARDKKFKKTVAKKIITSKKTSSYTGKNFTKGVKYYIRIRSYKTVDGKKKYSSWSNVKSVKSK